MKKAIAGLMGVLFVTLFASNAWAHGLRIDLGGNGFGFSVSDGRTGFSTFSYGYNHPYPYYNYSGYYSKRPYLGWGGYRGHHRHGHKHWNHHRHHHHHKGHHYRHQPRFKRGGHDHGRHHRKNHHNRRYWVR